MHTQPIPNLIPLSLCEAIHADPATAPLLIWLNGGPGSSSLFGILMVTPLDKLHWCFKILFLIHGPFLLNAEGQLRYNDFSWNQVGNTNFIAIASVWHISSKTVFSVRKCTLPGNAQRRRIFAFE